MGSAALFWLTVAAALGGTIWPRWRSLAFGLWVLAATVGGLVYPDWFVQWGTFRLDQLIVPLIQIIMFGMGTTLAWDDFTRAVREPRGVGIGVGLQFVVMPLSGAGLAWLFGYREELAAGIILTGACAGGVASNVMTYLARGNVALSVTMTACSTLLSPILTPLLMHWLAGTYVPIPVGTMMFSILNIIIMPILAGLLSHQILDAVPESVESIPLAKPPANATRFLGFLLAGLLLAGIAAIGFRQIPAESWGPLGPLRTGVCLGIGLIGGACLVRWLWIALRKEWLDRGLSVLSMSAIAVIVGIIVAGNAGTVRTAGAGLLGVAVLHNLIGFVCGYRLARLLGLNQTDSRTVAIEVGMQNSGMAASLAMQTLKSPTMAIAPALFSPSMNLTGSLLANWWKTHPPQEIISAPSAEQPMTEQIS